MELTCAIAKCLRLRPSGLPHQSSLRRNPGRVADDRDRKANLTRLEQAEVDREQKAKVDGNQMALEEENLRLKAENASLRRDLDRMKRLSAVIAETGRLP